MDRKGIERTEREQALARHGAYTLLSELYLHGLAPETLPRVTSVAALRMALAGEFDADEAAAAHQHIFGFNVFPYQSLFLSAVFLLGGDESSRVLDHYARSGYRCDAATSEADHIGHELGLLAYLSGAEADGLADGALPAVARVRQLQQILLDEHLLWWLPCFVVAVQRQQDAFYAAVATLTQELVVAHRLALLNEAPATAPPVTASLRLPPCPDVLADPATDLQDIASFLATPACTGVYLSRDDIAGLARAATLPRGFGDRRQMLANLLRSAGEFDGIPATVAALSDVAYDFAAAYGRFADAGAPFVEIGRAWEARVAGLRGLLTRLAIALTGD